MESLVRLLKNPCLVENRIAEAMYDSEKPAVHTRLRSRLRGRHRFSVSDYKAARKVLLSLSRRLDQMADRIEKLHQDNKTPTAGLLALVKHPQLHLHYVLQAAGLEDYYRTYDQLRQRTTPPPEMPAALSHALKTLAAQLRDGLAQAEMEAKEYVFSVGRGGGSHLPLEEQGKNKRVKI